MQPPLSPKRKRKYISHQSFTKYLDSQNTKEPNTKEMYNAIDAYYLTHARPYFYSIYNTTYNDAQKQNLDNSLHAYDKWKDEHEYFLDGLENSLLEPKEKVQIQCKLESTDDLLTLLKTHPYEESKTYNIDLKSLHKIETELQSLHNMVGMKTLKSCILKQLLYFIQGFADNKYQMNFVDYKHTVFVGPPGTGKTEVAKIIGKMYSKLGILKNNVFKKVTRTDLVAGYLGQTAIKTRKVIDECMGGVLFIDEAYSLQNNDSYAKECVDTLCEALSDCKQDLMVIVAGYEHELNETFFKVNSGMKSRFLWKFHMESYGANELCDIFLHKIKEQKWKPPVENLLPWIQERKDKFEYNGRDMEQLFTYVKVAHAHRVYGLEENEKRKINMDDIHHGYETFLENRKDDKMPNLYTMYI
jgi:SpoVK/Ycf46/Vps4 family AAA+-type ATPase